MRLLERNSTGKINLREFPHDKVPRYAILSHTWGDDEVTFKDLTDGAENKVGYKKIAFCGDQASRDGLQYFWVDTCCIDKSSSAELQEAINRMFRWYRGAAKCYVYLSDVSTKKRKARNQSSTASWEWAFRNSRWFTRGWTLQELIAPSSVEFFSREGVRLGDKTSLEQIIQDITGIALNALRGYPLSDFNVPERMAWMKERETTLAEDKAYSLFGIFDVQLPLLYGEGEEKAFNRLRGELNKASKDGHDPDSRCLAALRSTDPRDDKDRIENGKGDLFHDSYVWVLNNDDFKLWYNDPESRLLWIKGDPGKGKTMLLCGIINELSSAISRDQDYRLLSYFFCQATDARINNATAVLRGLIYMLVHQQPTLISHVRKKYDHAGEQLFKDVNAWVALSKIFTDILEDPCLRSAYVVVDALDECTTDLNQLLDLIVQKSAAHSNVKWIVSSRNWPSIEEHLNTSFQKLGLSLELNEKSISTAVAAYIQHKVDKLTKKQKYDNKTRDVVYRHLLSNANGTFLWVALVCQELVKISGWKVLQKLTAFPPGLDALYRRMMDQICGSEDAELCNRILAIVSTVYRPITLDELPSVVDMPGGVCGNYEALAEIIGLCGSFLTLRERTISFVHQSAKDFLLKEVTKDIFPFGMEDVHHSIFSRSLQVISKKLGRDVYKLGAPGFPIDQVKKPDPDPLAAAGYSCVHWIDHLHDCSGSQNAKKDLEDGGEVDNFLRQRYLHWLEALSLLGSLSNGMLSMTKLECLLQGHTSQLANIVRDGRRFIQYHKAIIENHPLQVYASALIFSPSHSLTRSRYQLEEPRWMVTKPIIENDWSACLQIFKGHGYLINSVAWSPDNTRVASASDDKTVKIWEPATGRCITTLKGHSNSVNSIVWSPDGTRVASASHDKTVKIWDPATGQCKTTLEGHSGWVESVAWSPDDTRVALASHDKTVKIWDPATGQCKITLEGHSSWVRSVAWSPDGTKVASASNDKTVKIWDPATGQCKTTLEDHNSLWVNSVTWSPDGTRVASASNDKTAKIWDLATGQCKTTLEGHGDWVESVAWSPDGTRVASASYDKKIKIWDPATGQCKATLEDHSGRVNSVAWSPDGTRVASASFGIRIWDLAIGQCKTTLEGHGDLVNSVAWSPDGAKVVSASDDNTVKIWDPATGQCKITLEGHSGRVKSVAWSPDGTRVASVSGINTVKTWDLATGQCKITLKGHSAGISSVAWSPDGTRVASASDDKTAKIWDLATGQCKTTLEDHSGWVSSVAWSPDGTKVASASNDMTAKIWDLATGQCKTTLEGHGDWVTSVAWSPDGTRVASASIDKTVKIWDLATSQCKMTLEISYTDYLQFDISDYLQTSVGVFDLRSTPASTDLVAAFHGHSVPSPRAKGYGLKNGWITYQGQNLLSLPPEYKRSTSSVFRTSMVIGCFSGRVLFLQFSEHISAL